MHKFLLSSLPFASLGFTQLSKDLILHADICLQLSACQSKMSPAAFEMHKEIVNFLWPAQQRLNELPTVCALLHHCSTNDVKERHHHSLLADYELDLTGNTYGKIKLKCQK